MATSCGTAVKLLVHITIKLGKARSRSIKEQKGVFAVRVTALVFAVALAILVLFFVAQTFLDQGVVLVEHQNHGSGQGAFKLFVQQRYKSSPTHR